MLLTWFSVQAKSNFQNSKVSLSVVNTDIEKILDEIENKTGYKFLYREKDLDHSKTITINLKEKEIRTVLDELFTESPINYEFLNDQIILKKGTSILESSNSKSTVQRQITGVVLDELGSALAGVNIVVKGTGKGSTTDFDGKYAISAGTGDVLSFSYLGFKSIEVVVGESSTINVTLEESTSALDEIVVTAQGIKREKKALGYAVSSVDAAVIQAKPEADVSRILTGKVSGLEINPGGGFLGSTANIIIRSKTSISGSNQPLFIIDGAPISGGRSFDIDPNNIAKIDVLKGLAASTLYGQDGRNGVIVITTKTGQGGAISDKKFEVTASTTLSFLEVANLPEFQNKYGQGGDRKSVV